MNLIMLELEIMQENIEESQPDRLHRFQIHGISGYFYDICRVNSVENPTLVRVCKSIPWELSRTHYPMEFTLDMCFFTMFQNRSFTIK